MINWKKRVTAILLGIVLTAGLIPATSQVSALVKPKTELKPITQMETSDLGDEDQLMAKQAKNTEEINEELQQIAEGEYKVDEKYSVEYIGDFEKVTSGYIVIYPDTLENSRTKWPVIVWANGTACAPVLYWDALCAMASEGYIVVASSDVMSGDGKSQRGEIDYIDALNQDSSSIFYKRVDMDKVGAAGHSQGGKSTVNAAVADSRIKAAVSIAGSNFTKEVTGLTTPTFFMTGTADTIVLSSIWVKPAYEKAEGPAAYAALKGGVHTTVCLDPEETVHYAIEWFDAYLINDNDARASFMEDGELFKDSDWKNVKSKGVEAVPTASIFGNGSIAVIIGIIALFAVIAAVVLRRKKAKVE